MGKSLGRKLANVPGAVERGPDSAGDGDPERRVNPARDGRVVTEKKRMPRKKDPLLAALIAKLPEQGNEWPEDQQVAWLRLMAMAFGAVYGGNAISTLFVQTSGAFKELAKPIAPVKPVRKPGFYIDPQGYVRNSGGKQIKPSEIDPGTVLFDERGQDGDLRAIIWGDGSMGLNGKDLTISAA